jgi:hypothetical protein
VYFLIEYSQRKAKLAFSDRLERKMPTHVANSSLSEMEVGSGAMCVFLMLPNTFTAFGVDSH